MTFIAFVSIFLVGFLSGGICCVAFAAWLETLTEEAPEKSTEKVSTFTPDILYYND